MVNSTFLIVLWYVLIIFSYFFGNKKLTINNSKISNLNYSFSTFCFISFFIFFSLIFKNNSDTNTYYNSFITNIYDSEIGFDLLQIFYKKVFGATFYSFAFLKITVIIFIIFIIYIYRLKLFIPAILFSPFIILSTQNGLRQGIAACLIGIGLTMLSKNKKTGFLILILSGYFHLSAWLILIALAGFVIIKFLVKNNFIALFFSLGSMIILFYLAQITKFIDILEYSSYFRKSIADININEIALNNNRRVDPLLKNFIFLVYFLFTTFILTIENKYIKYENNLKNARFLIGGFAILVYFIFDFHELSTRIIIYFMAIDLFIYSSIFFKENKNKSKLKLYILISFLFAPNQFTILNITL